MKAYMQYLVILLDDTSVAYCHADNPLTERRLMPLDTLRKAIRFGMKQNLMIQYVYPDYDLPEEYNTLIESIDHVKIGRDIPIYNTVPAHAESKTIVLRLSIADFIAHQYDIAALLPQVQRINICLTDIASFRDEQAEDYQHALTTLTQIIENLYKAQAGNNTQAGSSDVQMSGNNAQSPSHGGVGEVALEVAGQLSILTDRLALNEMHNCGAGVTNITVAPNGRFYLCPAFYYDECCGLSNRMNHRTQDASRSVGDLDSGLCIPNPQLLQLDHAPLCRKCDAFHCHRCIWLNDRLTMDANTPSHQQCVIAHLERNASRDLQQRLITDGFRFEHDIPAITYLDPFDVREEW